MYTCGGDVGRGLNNLRARKSVTGTREGSDQRRRRSRHPVLPGTQAVEIVKELAGGGLAFVEIYNDGVGAKDYLRDG